MKHLLLRGAVVGIALAIVVLAGAASPSGHARGISYSSLRPIQQKLVSGALAQALAPTSPSGKAPTAHAATSGCVNPTGGGDESDEADNECAPDNYAAPSGGGPGGGDPNYTPSGQGGCSENIGDNVKVNQNCQNVADPALAGRSQAQNEEAIAIDPNNPNHMVASQNDYRRGDGNCYGAYSLDGGKHWSDTTIPMSFVYGANTWGTAREYWQAGGDTSVAWDTKGNAYFSCQVFNRGANGLSPDPDQSSAFYIFRSTGNNGASWNFPGRPAVEHNDAAGSGTVLEDKNYLTVDNHVGSPFQDRLYETWTTFAADGTAYIYEAHSSDYGETFSTPVVVSTDSPLCPYTYGIGTPQGKCNENQFSNPFTGPDGALYVTWDNYNTATSNLSSPTDNSYQVLIAKSTDGGATFSAPVQVSPYFDLPDCLTYQNSDPFRACVPEKGPSTNSVFRATNYPVGDVNPKNPKQVVVSFGSYINQNSKESNGCTPAGFNTSTGQPLYTGAKTPGACNNDILISVSNNAGGTFTGTGADPRTETSVNPDPDQAKSDQFWQWQAFSKDGKLAIDYYDRQYGKSTGHPGVPADEYTGSSDITLSGSKDLVNWSTTRVTSSSMPPPTQFAGQFYGDYIGMDASDKAAPIWADTRDPELFICPGSGAPSVCTGTYSTPQGPLQANDENSYMSVVDIPNGGGGHGH